MEADTSPDREQPASSQKPKEKNRDDIKDYAETTMNELLGLYGYEKVSIKDTDHLNFGPYTSDRQSPCSSTDDTPNVALSEKENDTDDINSICSNPNESTLAAQHQNLVYALNTCCDTPTESDGKTESVTCSWCLKPGSKLLTLKTSNGARTFCSEGCFTNSRRAAFKKNKICDWCKHIRHTVNYVDFQDGEIQLQFCNEKCLNQYKMNIFCKETKEHLKQIQSQIRSFSSVSDDEDQVRSEDDSTDPMKLITPDLWLRKQRAKRPEESKDTESCLKKQAEDHVESDSSENMSTKLFDIKPEVRENVQEANVNYCCRVKEKHSKDTTGVHSHLHRPVAKEPPAAHNNRKPPVRLRQSDLSPPPSALPRVFPRRPTHSPRFGQHPGFPSEMNERHFRPLPGQRNPVLDGRMGDINPGNSPFPPLTVMIPFPVVIPVPIPIPLPIPCTKEQIKDFFKSKGSVSPDGPQPSDEFANFKREKRDSVERCGNGGIGTWSKPVPSSENMNIPSSAPNSTEIIHSPRIIRHDRNKLTVTSVPEKKSSKVPLVSSFVNHDEAIDLSTDKSGSGAPHKPSPEHQTSATDNIMPKIHIIDVKNEPPLSQKLPLPKTNLHYNKRRGLILDAPSLPKRPCSPVLKTRPYVATINRDVSGLHSQKRSTRAKLKSK